jgi:1,6-anhydro-N-acetylmuramate kinase
MTNVAHSRIRFECIECIAEAPHESTALCCGIPHVGVRVRTVQSSQNPEEAPGFTRAAVGETPRNSRIRLSPNISSTRVVKDSRRYSVWLEGRWPGSFTLCAPAKLKGNPPGFRQEISSSGRG